MIIHFLEDCSTLCMMGHFYRITVMESKVMSNGPFILAPWLSCRQCLCTWHIVCLPSSAGTASHIAGTVCVGFFCSLHELPPLFSFSMKSWSQSLPFSHFIDRLNLRASVQFFCFLSFWPTYLNFEGYINLRKLLQDIKPLHLWWE